MRLIYIILLSLLWGCNCGKYKVITGIVVGHDIIYTKNDGVYHETTIKCDDGSIRKRTGLSLYGVKVNTPIQFAIEPCEAYDAYDAYEKSN